MLFCATLVFSIESSAKESVIYGKLTESLSVFNTHRANGQGYNKTQLSSNSSRIGFKGSETISADVDVFWQIECGVAMTFAWSYPAINNFADLKRFCQSLKIIRNMSFSLVRKLENLAGKLHLLISKRS